MGASSSDLTQQYTPSVTGEKYHAVTQIIDDNLIGLQNGKIDLPIIQIQSLMSKTPTDDSQKFSIVDLLAER